MRIHIETDTISVAKEGDGDKVTIGEVLSATTLQFYEGQYFVTLRGDDILNVILLGYLALRMRALPKKSAG